MEGERGGERGGREKGGERGEKEREGGGDRWYMNIHSGHVHCIYIQSQKKYYFVEFGGRTELYTKQTTNSCKMNMLLVVSSRKLKKGLSTRQG